MVFRWAVWGEKRDLCEILRHSIGTFRRYFGPGARYVVYTDEPQEVASFLHKSAEVLSFYDRPGRLFDVSAKARTCWRKWCPAARIAPGETEVYVDSDIFIVGEPEELRRFCAGEPGDHFLAMQESVPDRRLFGLFQHRVPADAPAIHAGLVGQQPAADFTDELTAQFAWWSETARTTGDFYHDEQGAVAAALASYAGAGRLQLLPSDRYRIVSPRSNPCLERLDGISIIHTTFRGHPAFHRFRSAISDSSGVEIHEQRLSH